VYYINVCRYRRNKSQTGVSSIRRVCTVDSIEQLCGRIVQNILNKPLVLFVFKHRECDDNYDAFVAGKQSRPVLHVHAT
jgi:hypothetical protein